jgi:hypothetical protein
MLLHARKYAAHVERHMGEASGCSLDKLLAIEVKFLTIPTFRIEFGAAPCRVD